MKWRNRMHLRTHVRTPHFFLTSFFFVHRIACVRCAALRCVHVCVYVFAVVCHPFFPLDRRAGAGGRGRVSQFDVERGEGDLDYSEWCEVK